MGLAEAVKEYEREILEETFSRMMYACSHKSGTETNKSAVSHYRKIFNGIRGGKSLLINSEMWSTGFFIDKAFREGGDTGYSLAELSEEYKKFIGDSSASSDEWQSLSNDYVRSSMEFYQKLAGNAGAASQYDEAVKNAFHGREDYLVSRMRIMGHDFGLRLIRPGGIIMLDETSFVPCFRREVYIEDAQRIFAH